jgi:histidyl-tRNA synthetase
MEELGMLGEGSTPVEAFVTVFSPETEGAALAAARSLRDAGVKVRLALGGGKIGKQLKQADRYGIRWAVVVGPGEAAAGQVQLKDLRSGAQLTLPVAEAAAHLRAAGQG